MAGPPRTRSRCAGGHCRSHPAPCVDCAGLAGPEDGMPGLTWLAALDGMAWDAPEMVEAVTW